ncbi:MAG: phosphatase PAP2 family protein [Patescibacteria group bacterium]|nr:phosphatase PAP2 family protein [Patescibacteria group bacterium]MDE1946010.1 phosphatase PAP2 family protein [Patescibacteria group bacterium]
MTPLMDAIFIFSAQYLFVLPPVILGVYFFKRSRAEMKRMAFFAVPSGLLTYAVGVVASHVYVDPRPFVVGHFTPLIQHVADNGFPSDHTLLVASLAAVGMYWNKKLGIALWAIALAIAASRVAVGLHHPIDVVASMLIALAVTAFWHKISEKYRPAV